MSDLQPFCDEPNCTRCPADKAAAKEAGIFALKRQKQIMKLDLCLYSLAEQQEVNDLYDAFYNRHLAILESK